MLIFLRTAYVLLTDLWDYVITDLRDFRRDYPVVAWIAVAGVLVALFGCGQARANALWLGLGHGYTNSEGLNSQVIAYQHGSLLLQYEKFGGRRFVTSNQVSAAYQWRFREDRSIRPFLELGVSYNDRLINDPHDDPEIAYAWTDSPVVLEPGNEPLVTDKLTHHIAGGVEFWRLRLLVAHNSTGGQSARNQGIDRVSLQIRVPL